MLRMNLACPFVTEVLGTAVSVERIDLNDADEIVAVCRRGRQRQLIPILDLRLLSPRPAGWEWIEAHRHRARGGRLSRRSRSIGIKRAASIRLEMLGASPHRSACAEHRSSVPYDPPLDRPAQFQYIVRMASSKTIETRAHTTKDGRLNLSVDVDVADADVAVVVTVTPVPVGGHVDENGWPEGFFDRVAGSMPGLRRGSQGDFEERLPLE